MEYLRLQVNQPVRFKLITANPTQVSGKYGIRWEYQITVGGKVMVYEAMEKIVIKIDEFLAQGYGINSELVLIKKPNTAPNAFPGSTWITVELPDITNSQQNAPMAGMTGSQWKKQQPNQVEQPNWDEINASKADDILKGQCRNQAVEIICKQNLPLTELERIAVGLYKTWKNMKWTEEPAKKEILPSDLPWEPKQ